MVSQRNMGLMLAATDGALPGLTWLYFALSQFPIYLAPQLLKPLAQRFSARSPSPGDLILAATDAERPSTSVIRAAVRLPDANSSRGTRSSPISETMRSAWILRNRTPLPSASRVAM